MAILEIEDYWIDDDVCQSHVEFYCSECKRTWMVFDKRHQRPSQVCPFCGSEFSNYSKIIEEELWKHD